MLNGTGHDDDFPEHEPPSLEELAALAPRCTDSANVDALIEAHGRGYLFVAEWESWIAWDGKRWDRTGAKQKVINAAMLTARAEHYAVSCELKKAEEAYRQVLLAGQKDEDAEARIKHLQRLLKWHEQSQNGSRLEACAKLLETRLIIRLRELDRDPWLLNVANGTIDLRTAELLPHRQSDLITHLCDVEWDDSASAPTWTAFVNHSMGGSLELVTYLQRLVGYSITGLTTEHILAFFHGDGRNGKSTFVQTLRTMLGEYACAAPRDLLFEDKQGQRHPAELARLYGKRLAVCAEIGEHTTLDEAKVKDLTGGDSVAVRRMREDFWDLEPTHTLFLSGNHKPTVRGNDLGIWRRVRLVPWLVTVTDEEVDSSLPEKLRGELPGILRWAVNGCLEWARMGLAEPAQVLVATAEYREESDIMGEFMTTYLVFGKEERCTREALRLKYERWCEEVGHKPFGPKKVAARLKEKGVEGGSVRDMGRVRNGWIGCRLKTDLEMQSAAMPDTDNLS